MSEIRWQIKEESRSERGEICYGKTVKKFVLKVFRFHKGSGTFLSKRVV